MLPPDMKASFVHWLRRRKSLFRIAKKVQSAYVFLHNHVHADPNSLRKRPLLARRTRIGEGTVVDPTAFVSETGVRIGRNCRIGPSAVILAHSIIEDDAEIGPGCVVGSQGFVLLRKGLRTVAVKSTGGVRIGRGVKVEANSCFDRATFRGRTEVGDRTIIGPAVHIAHDVRTGADCRIAIQAMVAGQVAIGDGALIGHDSSISHFLEIGRGAVVKDSAVVTKNVDDGQVVEGNFAIDSAKFRKFMESNAASGGAGSR